MSSAGFRQSDDARAVMSRLGTFNAATKLGRVPEQAGSGSARWNCRQNTNSTSAWDAHGLCRVLCSGVIIVTQQAMATCRRRDSRRERFIVQC
jgi:hypothetical protein